jgi:hypothetical protein
MCYTPKGVLLRGWQWFTFRIVIQDYSFLKIKSMSNNKFEVDLGELELTEHQKTSISIAIQKTVAGELATIGLKKKIALIPVNEPNIWPGHILLGLIIRELDQERAEALI